MSNHTAGPGRGYYAVALIVFIIGELAFVVFLFDRLRNIEDSLEQVVVPGKKELQLSKVGRYTIFHEHRSVLGDKMYSTGADISSLQLGLASKDTGERIELSPASTHSTYSFGSRSGVSVFSFRIDEPGRYELSARYPKGEQTPEVVLAIDHGFLRKLLTAIFGGIAICLGSFVIAALIAIMTFVKRLAAKRQAEAGK